MSAALSAGARATERRHRRRNRRRSLVGRGDDGQRQAVSAGSLDAAIRL